MNQRKTCVIGANFSAVPLNESLDYWLNQLPLAIHLQFAPYDHAMQLLWIQIGASEPDYTIVLIQLERWLDRGATIADLDLNSQIDYFCTTLLAAARSRPTRFIIFICPPSPRLIADSVIVEAKKRLMAKIGNSDALYVITYEQMYEMYPVESYDNEFDTYANRIAKIPFSRSCFAGMGTMLARKLYNIEFPYRKVIVTDCDNTLWSGVVNEDGPTGIRILPGHAAMQEFLVKQSRGGRLICLCSKNEAEDVLHVFSHNPAMRIRQEHLAAWKINWESKPTNLEILSKELSLNLDSFVFIDDDPVECALVRTIHPEILTVQFPKDSETIAEILKHIWDLDLRKSTESDSKRTLYYRQEKQRRLAQAHRQSRQEFIASLKIAVRMNRATKDDAPRASQLTDRTTQFNLNGRRRTSSELEEIMNHETRSGMMIWASDRFGDYGSIGFLVYEHQDSRLRIETFVLSCRALGRGIEATIACELARVSDSLGCSILEFDYVPTKKNQAVQSFLREFGLRENENGWTISSKELSSAAQQARNAIL